MQSRQRNPFELAAEWLGRTVAGSRAGALQRRAARLARSTLADNGMRPTRSPAAPAWQSAIPHGCRALRQHREGSGYWSGQAHRSDLETTARSGTGWGSWMAAAKPEQPALPARLHLWSAWTPLRCARHTCHNSGSFPGYRDHSSCRPRQLSSPPRGAVSSMLMSLCCAARVI